MQVLSQKIIHFVRLQVRRSFYQIVSFLNQLAVALTWIFLFKKITQFLGTVMGKSNTMLNARRFCNFLIVEIHKPEDRNFRRRV